MSGTDWLRTQVKKQDGKGQDILPTADERGSADVEAWLRTFGVTHSAVVDIPLDKIDSKRSRQNQARSEALVSEAVDRFVVSLNNGEVFPPIVVYPSGGKAIIVDGNNREAAFRKARRDKIPGFILSPDTPSEVIQAMTVAANTRHGTTPELRWRLQQAVYLMDLGYTEEKASAYAAVNAGQMKNYRYEIRADARAKELGIREFHLLAQGAKTVLGAIKVDSVFMAASRLVIKAKMSITDTQALVRTIKRQTSEQEMLQEVADEASRRDLALRAQDILARKTTIKSAKMGLLAGLGQVAHADPDEIVRQVITDTERQELMKRCETAAERLLDIQSAIEKAMKEDEIRG